MCIRDSPQSVLRCWWTCFHSNQRCVSMCVPPLPLVGQGRWREISVGVFAYFHFRFQGKIEMWVDMFSQRQKVCVSIFAYFTFGFRARSRCGWTCFHNGERCVWVYWLTCTSGFRARSRCGWTCFQWTCRLPGRPLTSRPENPRGKRTLSNFPVKRTVSNFHFDISHRKPKRRGNNSVTTIRTTQEMRKKENNIKTTINYALQVTKLTNQRSEPEKAKCC